MLVDPSIAWREPAIELAPETLLPVQFDDLRRSNAARPPEHRLMLAVLEDAVRSYQLGCEAGNVRYRRLVQQTEEWFASEESDTPFSFVTICHVFGFDPDYVRDGLRRWRARYGTAHPGSRLVPLRIRRVCGSRHHVTLGRRRASNARA